VPIEQKLSVQKSTRKAKQCKDVLPRTRNRKFDQTRRSKAHNSKNSLLPKSKNNQTVRPKSQKSRNYIQKEVSKCLIGKPMSFISKKWRNGGGTRKLNLRKLNNTGTLKNPSTPIQKPQNVRITLILQRINSRIHILIIS